MTSCVVDEALEGVCKAFAIVHPEKCPDGIPAFGPEDDDEEAFSIMREYVEVCRTSLDVSGVPIEAAPTIAFASGFFEGVLFLRAGDPRAGDEVRRNFCSGGEG